MGWSRSGLFRKFAAILGALAILPVCLLSIQLIRISRRGLQGAVPERNQADSELVSAGRY